MNSKQISLHTLTVCSAATLLLGGCCIWKPKPTLGIPQIIRQPNDTIVTTNGFAKLKVDIQQKDTFNYRFDWFREVQVPACPDKSDNLAAFNFVLQDRPGSDTDTLHIDNASTNDQGSYFCIVSHKMSGHPEIEVQTRSRSAVLQVYEARNLFKPLGATNNNMTAITQINSWPMPGGSVSPSSICGFTGYNATHTFTEDNHNAPFTSVKATPCLLSVKRLNPGGTTTQLTTQEFTVYPFDLTSGASICTITNAADPTHVRQFPAQATTYWFPIYIKNANGSFYQLQVVFQ